MSPLYYLATRSSCRVGEGGKKRRHLLYTLKDGSRYWGVFAHDARETLGIGFNIDGLVALQNAYRFAGILSIEIKLLHMEINFYSGILWADYLGKVDISLCDRKWSYRMNDESVFYFYV